MLFISILTWEPEKDAEVVKRSAGEVTPTANEGARCIGDWTAIAGCRSFAVVDVHDPKVFATVARFWSDIAKFELIPIIETREWLNLQSSQK